MSTREADLRINARADADRPTPGPNHHTVVIVGGGTAGITVAAQLTRGLWNNTDVAVIEPSDRHFYQPAWTLVGGGAYRLEATCRPEAAVMPAKVTWLKKAVTEFQPDHSCVVTADGVKVGYDYLVVAAGLKIYWDKVAGLKETIGRNNVCTNYSYDTAGYTWKCIRNFQGGTAIFTQPKGAIKCGGAPQKICYLAEDYFRRKGIRNKAACGAGPATFGGGSFSCHCCPWQSPFWVAKYGRPALSIAVETIFGHHLVEIRGDAREAVFENVNNGERMVMQFDMMHVTPPQGPPEFIARSPLADAHGWVDVDKYTLQHVRYPNVFALGDCSNLPTSKTGAAVRKQAPVLVKNLRSLMAGRPLTARYNGYTSCPLVTRYGRVVLAEFDYEGNPLETFPFDQAKERWTMWLLKKYLLPVLYWHGMLKGRA
ncbi:MAG: pyridine nucleotide-disulfide oxidoreductase [Pirellulaceae bacterium]|nr:MAG: pyridine nucleotide-disulfide oxidoreductase [Pirellulaceae bacterium]